MNQHSFDSMLKWDRLRDSLWRNIISRQKPGDRFPSESELVSSYRISRSTVRQAISALVQDGALYRVQGKGTFVAREKPACYTFAVLLPYLYRHDSSPDAGADLFPRLVQSIEGEARRLGANIMLHLGDNPGSLEWKVDAFIRLSPDREPGPDIPRSIRDARIPLLSIDRYVDEPSVDCILTDNVQGAYRATQLLLERGFSRILCLTNSESNPTLQDRCAGYENAMQEAGLLPEVLILNDQQSELDRAVVIRRLQASISSRFAILATDASLLTGIWRTLQEDQASFNRTAFACFNEPFLHIPRDLFFLKIIPPFQEIGQCCMRILQERMNGTGPSEQYHILIDPEVIVNG